jgi:hypothetical protein
MSVSGGELGSLVLLRGDDMVDLLQDPLSYPVTDSVRQPEKEVPPLTILCVGRRDILRAANRD